MAAYLLCTTPIYGHFLPLLEIGHYLVSQGHDVEMITGSRFESRVEEAGLTFVPLPPECDFDDRDIDVAFPGRVGKKGLARLRFDFKAVFVDALPHQYRIVRSRLDGGTTFDGVLVDAAYTGILPILLGAAPRPPVLACGVIPLSLSSRDTAPFGLGLPPRSDAVGRLRNAVLNHLIRRVFLPGHKAAAQHLRTLTGRDMPVFLLDGASLTDVLLQLTCPGFEYPRSDLPSNVRFVGPVLPQHAGDFAAPGWWEEVLDHRQPIVHVTQGTIDNKDLTRLILPSISALAHEEVLVVVTTGGQPLPPDAEPLPANVRIADFLPYDLLLPHVDLVVTNGGYGGTQRCLALGLPVIVAGDREDKPEVAARVAWTGAGINLRTGTPPSKAILAAVRKVLADPAYREAARRLSAEYGRYSALPAIAAALATTRQRQDLSQQPPRRRAAKQTSRPVTTKGAVPRLNGRRTP
ncbi:MAG: glycosyl transferase [Micrococcaceae bacterium]|nr:glycosyl transferase [Micrococcaceae bacterium]